MIAICCTFVWPLLPLLLFAAFYMYSSRSKNYWKCQGVPHESYSLLSAATKPFRKEPVPGEGDLILLKKLGRVYGTFKGSTPTLIVSDPYLIKEVLVKRFANISSTSIGKFFDPLLDNMLSLCPVNPWSKIRPLLLPAFSTGNLRKMNPVIRECACNTAQRLMHLAEKQEDVDAEYIFGQYTAEVTVYCAFGVPVDYADMDEFVRMILSKKMPPSRQAFCDLFPFVAKMLKIGNRDTRYAHFAGRLAKRLIQRRLESTYDRTDLLQVVLEKLDETHAKDDELAKPENTIKDSRGTHTGSKIKRDLTENEMMAQCALYLLAGTETPLAPLSAAVRLLAEHPDIQCELRNEVDHCVAKNESEPGFEEISKLPYLNAVICETLRINPPVSRLSRVVVEDLTLANSGITLRKGMPVYVPVYALHHDPELFPEPHRFKPERFLHGDNETVGRYAYLPFGAGPRACIATRFALHAMKVCLFEAIRNVEFVKYAPHAKIYSQRSESLREDDVLHDMRLKVKRRI